MVISASAALLFGLLAFLCLKGRMVGPGSALVLFLFGFFIASTGAAGPINEICASLAGTLNHLS